MTEEKSVEVRASEMGWVPQETFRGDPERWIDAETFVKRGEELMPLLRANNKKLQEELQGVRHSLTETQNLLKASAESIEALKEFNSKAVREQAKEKRTEIVDAIKQARESGDVETEMALTDQLQEQTAAIKAAEKPARETPSVTTDYSSTPDWKAWTAENEWFGQDKRKTALALGIADELRTNGEKILGKSFLDKVSAEVEKIFGEPVRSGVSKVEGAGRSSGGNSSGSNGGKSFSDLPNDAKQACEKQSDRLVGPGRAFKTKEDWRRHYVTKYFEEA